MTKTNTAMAAALALGVATLPLSPAAHAMPVDGLTITATAISDGIQNVRWVCGMTMKTWPQLVAISGAPPPPGSLTDGRA